MGADMISYIIVGPKKLTLNSETESEILKLAKAAVAAAIKACEQDGEVDTGSGFFDFTRLTEEEKNLLATIDEHEVDYIAGLDAEAVFTEFVAMWNDCDSRDCNARDFTPPGGIVYQILTAGDMSWGDEPDGAGYQAIKAALALGIPTRLGIQ
jgi:hypothetical protein